MPSQKRHRKGNNRTQDKRARKEKADEWLQNPRPETRDTFVTVPSNKKFEAFYQAQLFETAGNEEWEEFVETLRRPLPACFRINPGYPFTKEMKIQLLEFAGQRQVIDGKEIAPVQEMAWYPNGDGYKLGTDRRMLRKSPELAPLHKWMLHHTENGNITRQEAVSMVPPLALNVEPHHKCLDMCAAPGSKTTQILETVHRSLGSDDEGLVIANDCDTDRAYMLVHQCRRINSPLLMVTTHKGQDFPTILPESRKGGDDGGGAFDRVLCDAPCSGDGTLRKTPNIWAKWSTSSAYSLYPLQLMIAQRGLKLVKEGGILVYSTCSMSPYEDEVVVAELLRTNPDTIELIDAREFVPNFKARPGLSDWLVLDDTSVSRKQKPRQDPATAAAAEGASTESKDGDAMEEAEEGAAVTSAETTETPAESAAPAEEVKKESDAFGLQRCKDMGMTQYFSHEEVPEAHKRRIRKCVFPPTEEEKSWMHLEKCLRCLPHDEDTGGFFVCAIRKKVQERAPEAAPAATAPAVFTAPTAEEEELAAADAKNKKFNRYSKNPIDLLQWDDESFQMVKEHFGLDSLTGKEFYIREDFNTAAKRANQQGEGQASKSVYYLPEAMRDIIRGDDKSKLKVVMAGIKVFERSQKGAFAGGGECGYRLNQDGVSVMAPHITKRKIKCSVQDFCNFLEGGLVSFTTLSPDVLQGLQAVSSGSVVCYYEFERGDIVESDGAGDSASGHDGRSHTFYAVCWRGIKNTLNVMCTKNDLEDMKHQFKALNIWRPKMASLVQKPVTVQSSESVSEAPPAPETSPADPSS